MNHQMQLLMLLSLFFLIWMMMTLLSEGKNNLMHLCVCVFVCVYMTGVAIDNSICIWCHGTLMQVCTHEHYNIYELCVYKEYVYDILMSNDSWYPNQCALSMLDVIGNVLLLMISIYVLELLYSYARRIIGIHI